MVVGLEVTNAILPSPFYADPMLPLAAMLPIFKDMLDSESVAPKDKKQVSEAGKFFAKWLVTGAVLVDNSIPTIVAVYDAILHSEGDR